MTHQQGDTGMNIVDQLREYPKDDVVLTDTMIFNEAADEIEALRAALVIHAGYAAEVERLREALEEMVNASVAMMRVISRDGLTVERLALELKASGIENGFGTRARAALDADRKDGT